MKGTGFGFVVQGMVPAPQGSKSRGALGQMYESNDKKLRPWRKLVTLSARQQAREVGWTTQDGPMAVSMTFYMPSPQKRRWWAPAGDPDYDKLARAVGDSLTDAGVISDDCRIVTALIEKRYAETPQHVGVAVMVQLAEEVIDLR